jgi:imidazolonepropionase-like amidohydrolase
MMTNRLFPLFSLLMIAGVCRVQAQVPGASDKPVVLAIRAARMLDVKNGRYIANPVLVIEADRIKAVGPNLSVPPGAQVIDLGNATLLPGLIDCHTHLLQAYNRRFGGDDNNIILTVTQMNTAKRALLGAKMAREVLESGITTVRDVGNSGMNGAIALRDAIQSGWVSGPRIVACARAISPPGGQFPNLNADVQNIVAQEYIPISGVDEARKAVRQSLYDGADCIKVIVDAGAVTLSLDEMKAIVDEAHRSGKTVAAHAIGDAAVVMAAQAGVDSIEHAYDLTDEQASLMAKNKVFLVPTDFPAAIYLMGYGALTAEERKRGENNFKWFTMHSRERLARAVKAGVRIAAGSDMYYDLSELTRGQASLTMLSAYAEAGMPSLEIIRAATLNASELLGMKDAIGSLEVGKFADIIAVDGDPLMDVTELQRVRFVMKSGLAVKRNLPNAKQ